MKSFIVILFLVIISTQIKAAGSYTNLYHIGEIGSGQNPVLEMGDVGKFQYNFSLNKMQVSHDGTNYYNIEADHTLSSPGTLQQKSINAYVNPISNLSNTNFASGAILNDLNDPGSPVSYFTLASSKGIKNYVDASSGGSPVNTGASSNFTGNISGTTLSQIGLVTLTSSQRPFRIILESLPGSLDSWIISKDVHGAATDFVRCRFLITRTLPSSVDISSQYLGQRELVAANSNYLYFAPSSVSGIDWSPPLGSVTYRISFASDSGNSTCTVQNVHVRVYEL